MNRKLSNAAEDQRLSVLDFSYYIFMASVPIEFLGTLYLKLPVSLSFLTGLFFAFNYFFCFLEKVNMGYTRYHALADDAPFDMALCCIGALSKGTRSSVLSIRFRNR